MSKNVHSPSKLNPSLTSRIRSLLGSCPTLTNVELYEVLKPILGNVNPRWLRCRICCVRGGLKRELAKKGGR